LTFGKSFSTHGLGSHSAGGSTADALIVCGDNLFIVNPGSKSISMFEIDHYNPIELKFIRAVDSHGDIPTSLACSTQLELLCVVNSGSANSVGCYSITTSGLHFLPHTLKHLGFILPSPISDNAFGTPSDLQFTKNLKYLVLSVKGNPPLSVPGLIATFPVLDGGHALGDIIRNEPVGIFPYSMSLIPKTVQGEQGFVFTDPGNLTPAYGLGLFELGRNGKIRPGSLVEIGIPGNIASCWSQFSPLTGNLYTTDSLGLLMTEFTVHVTLNGNLSATRVKQYEILGSPRDIVIIDIPNGEFMYILNPSVSNSSIRGIQVLKVNGPGNLVPRQTFVPPSDSITYQTGAPLSAYINGLGFYLCRK